MTFETVIPFLLIFGPLAVSLVLRMVLSRRPFITSGLVIASLIWFLLYAFLFAHVGAGRRRGSAWFGNKHDTDLARQGMTVMIDHYSGFLNIAVLATIVLSFVVIIDAFRIKRLMLTSPGDVRTPSRTWRHRR